MTHPATPRRNRDESDGPKGRTETVRKLRGAFAHLGEGLVDELLEERRKEADREQHGSDPRRERR
jgi:hypothetical protein